MSMTQRQTKHATTSVARNLTVKLRTWDYTERGEGPWRRKKKEMDAPRVSDRNGNQIVGGKGGRR